MPSWDDPRGPRSPGPRHDHERQRWQRDPRDRQGAGPERRSFSDEGGYRGEPGRYAQERDAEAWRRDRYGARYEDRTGYGRDEDAGSAGYRERRSVREDTQRYGQAGLQHGGEPSAYGGQEYGMESHHDGAGGWGYGGGAARERARANFDWQDPGIGQSQAGYSEQARSHGDETRYGEPARPHPDDDFDPDYLRWRDEQLRSHDREYQEWRRQQHAQYDDQYRQFRQERQRHFGQAFHEWRSQRSAVGGAPDTSVAPGVSGYGDKTAIPGGYNAASAVEKPSGALDPSGHLSADPALRQTGRGGGGRKRVVPAAGRRTGVRGQGDSSEFGKEPQAVRTAAQGEVQGETGGDDDKPRRRGGGR